MAVMYRDDVCAVCGESLPPDHFYCREHSVGVDDRLHEVGEVLPRLAGDLGRLHALLGQVAPETWDYLADEQGADLEWPPAPRLELRVDPDQVELDPDREPGYVRLRLDVPLPALLGALADGLRGPEFARLAAACAEARGANATH